MIRPRGGRAHVLDDDSSSLLLEILVNSSANPLVVRPVVLLLTEIANTPLPLTAAAAATAVAEEEKAEEAQEPPRLSAVRAEIEARLADGTLTPRGLDMAMQEVALAGRDHR